MGAVLFCFLFFFFFFFFFTSPSSGVPVFSFVGETDLSWRSFQRSCCELSVGSSGVLVVSSLGVSIGLRVRGVSFSSCLKSKVKIHLYLTGFWAQVLERLNQTTRTFCKLILEMLIFRTKDDFEESNVWFIK